MNDHALAVDITDLQTGYFGTTCACGIERHQQDAMKGELGRIDQPRDLILTEYLRASTLNHWFEKWWAECASGRNKTPRPLC